MSQGAAGSRTLNLNVLLRARRALARLPEPAGRQHPGAQAPRQRPPLEPDAADHEPAVGREGRDGGCQVTGTVELRTALPAGRTVGVVVSAPGFRVRAPRITLK